MDEEHPGSRHYNDASYYLLVALYDAAVVLARMPLHVLPDDPYLLDFETQLSYHTRAAILMAAFHLESRLFDFCWHNLGEHAAKAMEHLNLTQKTTAAHDILTRTALPAEVGRAVREFVGWRNDFAHGRRPGWPGSLAGFKRKRPSSRTDEPGEEVAETLHLMQQFLVICRHLDAISKHPDTTTSAGAYRELEDLLVRLRRFQFVDGRLVDKG